MKKLLKFLVLPVIFRILSSIKMGIDRILRYIFSTGTIKISKKYDIFKIPIEKLLRGGENGIRAYKYAEITNDFLRPSTPISDGPHVDLLKLYDDMGNAIFKKHIFEETPYYKNSLKSISLCGSQFYSDSEKIVKVAKRFIRQYNGDDLSHLKPHPGQSAMGKPLLVRKIRDSSYYELIDGNHRAARAFMGGEQHIKASIYDDEDVYTPLQRLLLDVIWINKRKWIYQPIEAPEIMENWVLVRKCTDRLQKIHSFLSENRLLPPAIGTYLDIGSYFGWFVSKMEEIGYESYGLERDHIAISVGKRMYGIKQGQIINSNIESFLAKTSKTYDVVSFLSVLHHFELSQDSLCPEDVIAKIDQITNKVLFFETGQSHEKDFSESLSKWTDDYIINWIKKNTTFRNIVDIGRDDDCVHPFENYYNRTLFACLR